MTDQDSGKGASRIIADWMGDGNGKGVGEFRVLSEEEQRELYDTLAEFMNLDVNIHSNFWQKRELDLLSTDEEELEFFEKWNLAPRVIGVMKAHLLRPIRKN